MQMMHRLAGIVADIGEHAVAAATDAPVPSHLIRHDEHLAQEAGIVAVKGRGARNVTLRHDQHMYRRLGCNVREGDDVIGLDQEWRVELARGDLAEEAVRITRLGHGGNHPSLWYAIAGCERRASVPLRSVCQTMPELPEVETVRRMLASSIVGRTILAIEERDFPGVMGDLTIAEASAALAGAEITAVERRAKYLFIRLDTDDALIVHLRMTGRLLVVPAAAAPIRFEHLAIKLNGDLALRFGDQRKFGRVLLARPEMIAALSRRLGPEPLSASLTGPQLYARLQRHQANIKSILLNQHVIAGLGNIYVDEALFLAGIHPLRAAASLTDDEASRLLRAIRRVLRQAIANQGTTFSSFENPYGERGNNADALLVYGKGKTGLPCPRCGTLLTRLVIGGRGTTVCPRCQPLPSAEPDSMRDSPD